MSYGHFPYVSQSLQYLEHSLLKITIYNIQKFTSLRIQFELLTDWFLGRLLRFQQSHIQAESFPIFFFVLFCIIHRKTFFDKFMVRKF